jgi:uncharacterized protein YjbI with pentapeptide repeats
MAIIKNVCFNYANFNNGKFFQVQFINTNFIKASFRGAIIHSAFLDSSSRIGNTDMTGASLNAISGLNDDTLGEPFYFNEVNYFWLVKKSYSKSHC